MPQVDLSNVSSPELRSLLDAARQRGQAAEAYQILQEMAARRRGEASTGPKMIAIDLSDPLGHDEPLTLGVERPPPPAKAEEESDDLDWALSLDTRPSSRRLRKPPEERAKEAKENKAKRRAEAAPRRPRWTALGFASGTALGLVLGLGVARETFSAPDSPAATIFPAAPMLRIEAPAATPAPPPPAPPAATEVATAEPAPAEAPNVADAVQTVSTQAVPPPPAPPAAEEEAAPAAEAAPAEVAEAEEAPVSKACAHKPTPADRAICEDARLQKLQRELRLAYADALAAHEDRARLRERQLAWRDARNEVGDPERLARLYEARIRKLNAATAEARRER